MDNPNINPVWDAFLGHTTDTGTIRMLLGVLVFVALGGLLFSTLF